MERYEQGTQIGSGGFGRVYNATRAEDGWTGVLKFLKEDYNGDSLRRFQREVRIQAQMEHPNIVPVVAMNLNADPPWFVMPKAESNLRTYVREHHGEDELPIFIAVASGVAYAHNNGIIHRDLKPENILLFGGEEGQPRPAVSDFGLGKEIERETPTLTQDNIGMGTYQYAAPEQCRDAKSVNERADIYALGKILYELLTGKFPYPSMDWGLVPRRFTYIIRKATSEAPDDRYWAVSDLLDSIDLLTQQRSAFDKPADTLQRLTAEIMEKQVFDRASTEPIVRFLCENADDYQMLIKVLPRIPEPLLMGLIEHHAEAFNTVLRDYDKHLDDGLTFDYCDVAADFYETVFEATTDDSVRQLVLKRLFRLGCDYNRFYVGQVFARIVCSLQDPSLIMAARDIIAGDQRAASFHIPYFRDYTIPHAIRKVLPEKE